MIAKTLTQISNILDKENITAENVEKFLSGINDSCARDMAMRALGMDIGLCGSKYYMVGFRRACLSFLGNFAIRKD